MPRQLVSQVSGYAAAKGCGWLEILEVKGGDIALRSHVVTRYSKDE
jgi:hypothetical protein